MKFFMGILLINFLSACATMHPEELTRPAKAAAAGASSKAGERPEGYISDARSGVVRDSSGDCWRTGYWTPAWAIYECDPDLLPKPVKIVEAPPLAAAPPPPPPLLPAPPIAESRIDLVPILFGTNRKKSGNNDNDPEVYFTDKEADNDEQGNQLTLGRALVRVPPSHIQGVLERPGLFRKALEKLQPSFMMTVLRWEFKAVDPKIHFSFAGPIQELTDESFKSALKKSIDESKTRSAVLFVHGYANSFADAATRTAQLVFDLRLAQYEVVPLMFSWPSDPLMSLGLSNYIAAKDRARSAGRQLASFVEKIMAATDIAVVHVIAHSMGAEVLGEAFRNLGEQKLVTRRGGHLVPIFNQVILAAPDIRAKDFDNVIRPAIESEHKITNYASSNDNALIISKDANAGPRAGDTGTQMELIKDVETVDASAVNNKSLGHSFFAESVPLIQDMTKLMSSGAAAKARGLKAVRRGTSTYWKMVLP